MKKRVIVITDPHCGQVAGLTPPPWQLKETKTSTTKRNKWAILQKDLWRHYIELLDEYKPFHVCLSLGDSIDGKGQRSGGSELITADREEQCDMAVVVHNEVRARSKGKFRMIGVYGTPYHGGVDEDWEDIVAQRAGFYKIGSHEWIDVNGCIIDIKHFVSASIIPHGRHTSIARDKLWNSLWAEAGLTPKANVILRGHVHYATFCGAPGWVAMTLPALQGMGTKFGARKCVGLVDWGITIIDVDEDGSFDFIQDTIRIDSQKTKAIIL